MERKMFKKLIDWKNSPNRQPLLLQGARQVGKTYLTLEFGKRCFINTVYLNFEGMSYLEEIFEPDLNPARIIREISARMSVSIIPEQTLIFFDEIQASERALTSLKYFCEQSPEYCVIAAGSLFGVAVNREQYSFPVGKVDMFTMYPMDFEEFLWAIDEARIAELIREAFDEAKPFSLHARAMELYRRYLVIGGMPQAVKAFIDTKDFNSVLAVQHTLGDAYIADMAKYSSPQESARTMAAWHSIPAQLAKENRKFQYKLIKSGARAYQYTLALEWLKAAGMVNKCVLAREGLLPLAAYADNDAFKIYMVDTGLLCAKFTIPANVVINSPDSFNGFKGALAENYVMQALVANGIQPYYWVSEGKAEVDFIFQRSDGSIIPVEVKSADNVRSKSLQVFRKKYAIDFSYRISARNFGFEDGIMSVPLYAVFCLRGNG